METWNYNDIEKIVIKKETEETRRQLAKTADTLTAKQQNRLSRYN